MRFYEGLFYAYFRWAKRLNLDPSPESSAIFSLTIVVALNLSTGLKLAEVYGGYVSEAVHASWFPYAVVFTVFTLNYFLLGTKRRFTAIAARHEHESARRRKIQGALAAFLFLEGLTVFLVTM